MTEEELQVRAHVETGRQLEAAQVHRRHVRGLSRLEVADLGIEPERPPYRVREGGSRICFVRDPDGYRIELIEANPADE